MKKILAILLCITLIAVLAVPAMALVDVPANKATPVIDGVRDDVYSGPFDIATHYQKADETNSMNSATGKVWTAWDESALYFYVEVYDKTPNYQNDANNDNIEIMIDWLNGGATGNGGSITGRNADDTGWDYEPGTVEGYPFWQVRIPSGPDLDGFQDISGAVWSDLGWGGVDWSAADAAAVTEFVTVPIDGAYRNGYIVEAKIGIPAGVALSEGMVIPFDIQICDNINGEGTRDGQVFMAPSEYNDMQWAVPSTLMARMALGGAYVAAVEVVEVAADVVDDTAAGGGGDAPVPVVDDTPAPPPPAGTGPSSPRVGDSGAIMLVVLAVALAGAYFIARRARTKI